MQGGSEGYLRRIVPEIAKRGISQHVVSLVAGGYHAEGLKAEGIPVTELGLRRGVPDPRGILRLRQLIAEFQPAVVQGWLYHANLLALVANSVVSKAIRPKLIWGSRSAEMDQTRYGLSLRVAVNGSAMLSRIPDCIVANSEVGKADHIRLGFCDERFHVIANGVDVERFHPDAAARQEVRRELGIESDAVIAGVFARNDPMKNLDDILRVVGQADGFHTLFAGQGTDQLPASARCHFMGARSDVSRLMAACDFTVLASKSEGFPNVVAESLSCGVPVVTADVGDAARIVGDAGQVFGAEDWNGLLAALRTYAVMEPSERARLGKMGRQRVVGDFSLERSVANFVQLYESLNA